MAESWQGRRRGWCRWWGWGGESHFALVIVHPSAVDELRLGANQKRILHELKEGEWGEVLVNP